MSKWDKLIVTVAVIAVALFAYVLATERMSAEFVSATVTPASEAPERFSDLSSLISSGSLGENQFAAMTSSDPDDYYLIDFTASLSGVCPFPAKWTTMNVYPDAGDVVFMQSDPVTVAPFSKGLVKGTLLTTNIESKRTGLGGVFHIGARYDVQS